MATVCAYVIAIKDGDNIKSPVKVGIASNPVKRVRDLQTACPYELFLVKHLRLPNREIAADLERCFHALHAEARCRGEWFDIAPEQAAFFLGLYLRWSLSLLTSLNEEERNLAVALAEAPL